MMLDLSHCVEDSAHSYIVVSEKGRKAVFRNPEGARFLKIRVDNCLITDSSRKRSDFIVTKPNVGSVIIELKGKNVTQAYEQLFATLRHDECQDWLEKRKVLLIVCSRVPAFMASDAKFREKCRKEGVRAKIVCDQRELRLENLLGLQLDDAESGEMTSRKATARAKRQEPARKRK